MQLRSEISRRLGTALDWSALIDDLEKEADTLADAEEKSARLQAIASLAEEVIPERDRALAIYQKAWKTFPSNIQALSHARQVYDEMGRPDMVAKVGEMELKAVILPRAKGELALLVGNRYLDSGQKDKAEKVLQIALEHLPDPTPAQDALAAAQYNPEDWIDEVERLRAQATKTDPAKASRLCLRAARILRAEMPDDPSVEQTLRQALAYDPENAEAGYLLGLVLAKNTRWDELTKNQDERASALEDHHSRALLYRRFALEWIQRFKDKERAAVFFEKALALAYTNGADELPSHIAALNVLRETMGARREWGKVLALVDQALAARLSDERKLLYAMTGAVIAWKELGDADKARPYFDAMRSLASDSPILREYDAAHPAPAAPVVAQSSAPPAPTAKLADEDEPELSYSRAESSVPKAAAREASGPKASAPEPKAEPKKETKKEKAAAAAAAKEAPRKEATAPAAAPRAEVDAGPETISDAQMNLMQLAAGLESSGAAPDKAIDAWKKAIVADPTKRAPRRRLAEVLRRIERWNALVEALKEEEAKACTSPDDKVPVLQEMVEIYRDRLRLDVMVAGTLTQILNHQPQNVDVLDQLTAQYEAMKRWPDLVGTLKKKVPAVGSDAEKVALHLQIANLYIEKFSNQAEAIKSFEAALELDPDNEEAAAHLKQVYEKRRDWDKLIALEKREIARGGDGAERLRRSVDLAKLASEKLKKPAVSIELWSAVTAIDPDHLEALGELEKLYEREKQWEKLSDVSERQADLAPDAARKVAALQKLGILYTEKVSDPEKAVAAWRRLLAVEPENRRGQDALKKLYVAQKAWGDLETFYAGQGKLDEFARVLERQVDVEDDATKATMSNRLAVLYRDQLGKPQAAVKWLEKVLSLDAQNLEAAEALIPLYEQAKDPKKLTGVLEIQLAQTTDPHEKKQRIQRIAALYEQSLRDKQTAYGWWLKAFDADPDDEAVRGEVERLAGETGGWPALVGAYEGAYGRLASALPLMSVVARVQEAQLGDVERAIATNQKILAEDDVNEAALDALERLYLGGQRYEELLKVLGKKLELTMDPEARKLLQLKVGQLYEDEMKDDAKAIAAYRGILDDGPSPETERDVLAALDRMLERKQSWKELAEIIERELTLVGPENPGPHIALKYRLGQVRETHLDDALGAIDAYRDILDLQPQHEGARRALEARLSSAEHQLTAAAILEPIYEKVEAWKDLVGVHEIQLKREESKEQRVELLLKIGELQSTRLGDGAAAFDAAARGFKEDPSRPEARANLDRLAQIVDDGWPRVVALLEEALDPKRADDLEPALVHELSRKAAAAYEERLERSDKAVQHYQRALTIEPEDAEALEALDRIFTREEKYAELLEVYKKKVDLARDPEIRLALLHRIASLWEEMLGNHEQAILTYKEILGQEHEDLRALRALDRLYQHQGQWQDLADNLVRQLALTEDRGEQVSLLGRLAALREQKLSETASAIDTYRQVLELAPEHPGAIEALERLIKDPSGEHELTIATILEPVYQASGAWQKQVGVYEIMARHAFDPARKIELLHQIGELYEVGDDTEHAFDSYARAFREDPAGAETQKRLDRLARVHGKWPQIVRLIDEVATGVGDDELKIALYTRLAQIHELELAQDEEAVKTHARILEVDPRHLAAASAIEAIHERNSDYARLVAALKRKAEIVDEVPAKKGLLYKAAQIEEEILEQPDEAIATYRTVLGIDDIDSFSMDALERLYSRLGRWGQLKDVYAKKAELAQEPEDKKRMLMVLGQVHDRELGDVPKAIETYQAILDLDPGDLGAIQALDRLYGQAGRWYDLLQILEREVELSETTGTTVALKHRIGELWEKELHDLVRAVESYREALELDGAHAPTLKALDGLAHAKEGGEPVLAAQVLEPIYERSAEFDKLVDLLEVMVKHAEDPLRKVELYHRIAELHERRLDRADAAFEAYGRALKEDSGNEATLANLERLAEQTRGYATYAQLLEEELKKNLDPHRQVDLLLRLARAYEEELAQPPQAIATYRRVLDVDPENRPAIAALDRLFEAGEAWNDLAEILRKEIRLAGSDDEVIAISFRLGQLYEHRLTDLPQAVEVYRDILGQDPSHAPTLAALELIFLEGHLQVEIGNIIEPLYRSSGEWEKLHKIFEVQLAKLTDVTERQAMYQRLAELAEQKLAAEGGFQRAFRWWGLASLEDPRNERAFEELERLASELANWEELVQVYGEGLNRHVEGDIQKSLLLRTARIFDVELKDATRAEESYLRVLGLDQKEPNALAALDRIYETSGMFNELAEILNRRVAVTDSTEELLDLHFRLGRIQSDVLGDLDASIASYEKILTEDSRNRTALECLEKVYFRREEWQKLYDIYEKLVDVAKGDEELAEVYARMARLSSDALSDDDRASDLWGRVIDLRGEDPIGLQALGEIYERRELWRELVDVLERQVRTAHEPPAQIVIYKRLGRVWNDKLGRERNALEAWVHAFERDPSDLETLRHLAVLYRATQAWEELSDTLRRILEVGQVNADVSEQELVELYAQLGQLEGEVLGRTNDAVEAWRRVLALDPANEQALSSLEALFTREGRWEDCIEVLEKRAAVAPTDRARLDTLLQAAAIWEDKVSNKTQAAQVYERVRGVEPANAIASAQLEAIYREQYDWTKLTEVLLERVEHTEQPADRISILQGVARIYEEEVNDQESAFVVLQAAFKEDYAYEPVAKDLERLATGAGKWEELLADYTQVVQGLERTEPSKAADLWVKIGRWYADHMSHVDYAIHSVQAALKIDSKHLGALAAMADFQRKRGSWGELIETLGKHAAIEPDPQKRVELYLSLAELLETQLMDPMQAMTAYRAALDADPVQPDALRALDRLYRQSEMWEQLIDILGRKAEASTDPDEQVRLRLEIGRHWDERLNEPGAAIDAFRQVLTIDPQSLNALRALERLYERTGQAEAYLDVLEQQLDASPTESEKVSLYQRMAAAWEERFGKLDRSAECFEKILVLDERNSGAFRELERLYDQEKKWDSLVDIYRRHILAATDPPTRIDLYCAMGRIYEDELRDFDRAIEAYSDVLTFDPDETRSLDALGRLYEKIEEWDRAIDTTSRLVDVTADPRMRVELLHRIGRIQDERLQDAASAEERFLAALSIEPGHVGSMNSLVGLYKKRGDWLKAATMMVRAEQHSNHPLEKVRLLSEAATITREKLQDDARATEYYAAALAIDPEHVESGEPVADLYFQQGRWQELEPVIDMLVRKAPQLKRDSRWLNDLYFRAARTADELQHNEKALKFYKAAYDLDSTHLPTLLGRANLLFKMQDWDAAGKIYQTILVQHRDAQKESDVVDIYFRLGQVRLKLNERKKALNMFEKALELDPNHKDTLLAVIDLQAQQGDWEAVIHAKRSLLPRADAEEKFRILTEVGDTYHGKLQNQQKAIAAYSEALEVKPKDRQVLQKVLELYSETKQWKKSIEVMQLFAELESNPLRRGKYLYAAGVTCRDEVKSLDDSVTFFNQALDAYFADPDKVLAQDLQGYLKPFEAIDKIHTSKKDWKNLERSYRQMIKRMPQRPGDGLLVMLWHNLGEIYRSRLKDLKAAAQAFEVASQLDPGNKQRHEILAELYMASGPEMAEKAVAEHMTMLKAEPFRIESYKALRKIYMDAHQYDKAWCVCNTLSFLKKADAEEQQFFEQYKPKGFVRAKQRITDDIWKKVLHPETDRYVSAIFSAIWQGAALVHAQPHKTFGLKRKDKRQIETDQLLFSKVFYYVSQVLNVPLPEVYLQPEQPGEILLANAEEKGQLLPSFVIRSNLLQGRPEKELAFVSAKQLTYLRPEHYLKMALPTNAAMKTAFMSALLVVNPKFPVKPDMVPLVQQYLPHLQAKLAQHPQWMEQLHHVVKRFLQAGQDVDLVRWGNAVEATSHRVGFILCGDLEVAARMVSMEPVVVGGPQAKDKIKELVLYSISEDYFGVRAHLGTVIG